MLRLGETGEMVGAARAGKPDHESEPEERTDSAQPDNPPAEQGRGV